MLAELLIEAGPFETRVASLVKGRAVSFEIMPGGGELAVGALHLARVTRIEPSLQAAFLALGDDAEGLMRLRDAPRRKGANGDAGPPLHEGEMLVVEIERAAYGGKGPRVSARPELTERLLVLRPAARELALSARLDDAAKARLRTWAATTTSRRDGLGLTIRTAAAQADEAELDAALDRLLARWQAITAKVRAARGPTLLAAAPHPILQTLRAADPATLAAIRIEGDAAFAEARALAAREWPALLSLLQVHRDGEPLFLAHGVDAAIEEALEPRLALPGGGDLVIETTTALTAIDVNGPGGRNSDAELTALEINLRAAAAIPGALRLRNIAGLVVVDFVGMRDRRHWQQVMAKLEAGFRADPAEVVLEQPDRFGLVALSRARKGPSLAERLLEPAADGLRLSLEAAASKLAREALRDARHRVGGKLRLVAAPALAHYMEKHAEALARAIARPLAIVADATLARGEERLDWET
ncbi:ribonuclease E/G [Oceanibacterium hippocampi]|uniref:Ribonuclease E n=1 Tax=Oceanibacterium hippocampi TaxID=745714 RepID=A0A1Y5S4N8_9PROT|nr:ribonuclease E/G [Oceanibacterium hippocampi]SLN31227.1 Ribonuclease E [Oceanibacterium hippocampi]